MKIKLFLRAKMTALAMLLLTVLAVGLALWAITGNPSVVGLVEAIICVTALVALGVEYARCARFYGSMSQLVEQLEHPYQLHSLMEAPSQADQRLVFDALSAMGRASSSEVERALAQNQENREYMESWVHEVKTPLAAALLACDRVAEPERSLIRGDIERALREVNQVLWYARSVNPAADFVIREISLLELVQRACRMEARTLIEQGVLPLVDVPVDTLVRADEKQVGFVLSQILSNAAKYGAKTIRFTVEESRDEVGARVTTLVVADDGWGIPPQDVPRVFDRGFTGERGRQAGSSTGMGMHIAATLCQKMALGLTLRSDGETGTTVMLRFSQDARRQSW